jgi:hypothetical protein
VRPILAHTRSIVDEDEVQVTVLPPGPRLLERAACDLLHRFAVPALVSRTSILERLVRSGNVRLIRRRLTAVAGPRTQQAEDERDDDHRADHDQDDG